MSNPGMSVRGQLSLLYCLLLAWPLSSSAASTGGRDDRDVFRLLVFHTNDMHARFAPVDQEGSICGDRSSQCYGGFARLKSVVEQERAAAARAAADGTLFLNAGDTFQGSPIYTYFKWPVVARMVQTLGIDVMSLGNHEFDEGVNDVKSFIQNITVPVVASNLDLSDEPSLANEPNLMKSKVLTVNGRKIGIIGYLTPETKTLANVGKVKILPEVPLIRTEAKRLKNEGVTIIIALGHSGFEMDKLIAREVDEIDLVIGGHSNTFLYSGKAPDVETPSGPYPFLVKQSNTNRKVPVVQAYCYTKYLGKLWIEFDETGEVIRSYGNPILLDSHFEQDPEVLDIVRSYEIPINAETNHVVGSTSVFLEGINEYCRLRECNMGNFLTDSLIDYNIRMNFNSFDLSKYWTDAPIAMTQSGGIRSNINHLNRNGNITTGDVLSSLPFQNDMGKMTTKGSDIWDALEYSVRRYSVQDQYGEFLQVSGLKVVIDLGQPSGKRVKSVRARCGNCTVPVYEKLDLNADYTIITNRYLYEGGDGFSFKKATLFHIMGMTDSKIMMNEIRIKSPIRPEIGERIVLLNAEKLQTTGKSSSGGRQQVASTRLSNFIVPLTIVISLTVTWSL